VCANGGRTWVTGRCVVVACVTSRHVDRAEFDRSCRCRCCSCVHLLSAYDPLVLGSRRYSHLRSTSLRPPSSCAMSASKFAEKLIILCDHATGIQCRLYQLVDYKRPPLFAKDSEIEKFAKLFLKKFPEFPDTLNKVRRQKRHSDQTAMSHTRTESQFAHPSVPHVCVSTRSS
jgi:hypothetical protein